MASHAQKSEMIVNLSKSLSNADFECVNLISYLNSEKFHCGDKLDNYVNIMDIFEYVQNIRDKISEHLTDQIAL